jgi:hypothetical protein
MQSTVSGVPGAQEDCLSFSRNIDPGGLMNRVKIRFGNRREYF